MSRSRRPRQPFLKNGREWERKFSDKAKRRANTALKAGAFDVIPPRVDRECRHQEGWAH
jgi:hypothetical protein